MTALDQTMIVRLKNVGGKLLTLPKSLSSVDKLLKLLDKLEVVLSTVEQSPSESVQEALVTSKKALISLELIRHSDEDVKISVTSCITEIARISAPDAPYDDEQMKEIFKLIVAAFEKLSPVSGRCYKKAVSILNNVAKVHLALVMLDLECYDLVIEMFQNLQRIIRSNHPPGVMLSMESIMTQVLDESEEISLDHLTPLLDSVRKENRTFSPIAWTLGKKVITNCAVKIKPYLMKAVDSTGRALDEYAQIVASICQNGSESPQHDHSNGSEILVTKGLESDMACMRVVAQIIDDTKSNIGSSNASTMGSEINKKDGSKRQRHSDLTSSNAKTNSETGNVDSFRELKSENELDTMPKKRGYKPNSLMSPEEGYDLSWIYMGRKTEKRTSILMSDKTDENTHAAPLSMNPGIPNGSRPKRGRRRKRSSTGNQDVDPNSVSKSKKDNLNALLKVPSLELPCDRLKKESEVRKDSEVKPRALKLKIKFPAKIEDKTATVPEPVVANMESKVSWEDEEKPKSAMNVEVANREEELITESASKPLHGLEEAPQTRLRRRRRTIASEYNDLLVGSRIEVWWPKDKMFYKGVVDSYDPIKGKHKIVYDDGDVEVLNLKNQRWKLITDDVSPEEEQETALQKLVEISELVQKSQEKSESKPAMVASVNSRSGGRASASFSKSKYMKSAGKYVDTSALVRPDLAEKSMDAPPRIEDGQDFAGKPNTRRMKTGLGMEKNKPGTKHAQKAK